MPLTAGTRLGPYEVRELLGSGGMGEVYRARDSELNRGLAIKVLHPALLADASRRRRLLQEARAAAAINHPNIATIYAVGDADAGPYIAMELVEGQTLRVLLGKGTIPLEGAVRIATDIVAGISEAHRRNVVHRDLKPENIVITPASGVKILDFGIAKVLEDESHTSETNGTETHSATRNTIVGTTTHMAPEQIRGETVDPRADIFAFGIILYEMATGELPFRGRTPMDTLAAILNHPAVVPSKKNPRVPAALDRIILRCLEKEREARWTHAADLLAELRMLQEAISESSRHPAQGAARAGPETGGRKRIVVLPFDNLGAPDDEFFASGITEEIISRLAGIASLGVISRTTAMHYDRSGKTIGQIGDELGVDYVLDGSVRWARSANAMSRVRITPQLIRVSDDTHLWAHRYDKVIDDIFQIQSDIAEHVTSQLGVRLLEGELEELHARPTRNVDAYQAYLRGLFYERPRGFLEERDRLAVEMFEEAVRLDPSFALAHAELAIAHAALYHYGFDHSEERRAQAARAVHEAVRLAPESPRVRLAMGYYYYWCERDFARAIEELTTAERGMPGNSEVLAAIGFVRRRQGLFDVALTHFERAAELNPIDTHFAIQLADTLAMVRRYGEADAQYDLSIRFHPDQIAAYVAKAELYWTWQGDTDAARKALEAMPEANSQSSFGFVHWFWQEIFEGKYEGALARVTRLSDDVVNRDTKNLLAAQAYALLGDTGRSMEAYEDARIAFERESRAQPANYWVRATLGLVYAGLGRNEEAIRDGRTAAELCPPSADPLDGAAFLKTLALILTIVGEYDAATREIERLLPHAAGSSVEYLPLVPSGFSVPLLQLDPRWKRLWQYRPFQQMIERVTASGRK